MSQTTIPLLIQRQEAADRLGLHFWKLEDLRKRGLIPEAIKVGRYYVFPADQIDAIRQRLIERGFIKARQTEGATNAG
jgi:hypothetical protein